VRSITRANAEAAAKRRVEVAGEDVLPEVQRADLRAKVSARSAIVLSQRVLQIAVRAEIAVGIGPCPGHRRAQPSGRLQRTVGQASLRRLQVFARVDLERRLAGPEDVPRQAHARREVVVATDTLSLRIGHGSRKEDRRSENDDEDQQTHRQGAEDRQEHRREHHRSVE